MVSSYSSQISFFTAILGAVGQFLDFPGAGMVLGFGVAFFTFLKLQENMCKRCLKK